MSKAILEPQYYYLNFPSFQVTTIKTKLEHPESTTHALHLLLRHRREIAEKIAPQIAPEISAEIASCERSGARPSELERARSASEREPGPFNEKRASDSEKV